ncbi:unnamed protein product [Closterium sp. Naga37s-1]|nr:unnamed protein product [Closterium sp. Naga37s-1]
MTRMSGGGQQRVQAPRRIGEYEVGGTLGEGTFAKVKYAVHATTGEPVAMKVLDKEKIIRHKMVDQIKREISVMKLVRHPNVVRLYEVLASRTKIYIILEFVTGGELFDRIVNKGRLEEDEARRYFQQLMDAMEYCHSKGVAHRDLKPENLLLDSKDNIKISDFGLSALPQQVRADGLLHTTCGTPNYVAPEVLSDRGYNGVLADIWSCGVILYVLLAGFLPFDEPDVPSLYRKQQQQQQQQQQHQQQQQQQEQRGSGGAGDSKEAHRGGENVPCSMVCEEVHADRHLLAAGVRGVTSGTVRGMRGSRGGVGGTIEEGEAEGEDSGDDSGGEAGGGGGRGGMGGDWGEGRGGESGESGEGRRGGEREDGGWGNMGRLVGRVEAAAEELGWHVEREGFKYRIELRHAALATPAEAAPAVAAAVGSPPTTEALTLPVAATARAADAAPAAAATPAVAAAVTTPTTTEAIPLPVAAPAEVIRAADAATLSVAAETAETAETAVARGTAEASEATDELGAAAEAASPAQAYTGSPAVAGDVELSAAVARLTVVAAIALEVFAILPGLLMVEMRHEKGGTQEAMQMRQALRAKLQDLVTAPHAPNMPTNKGTARGGISSTSGSSSNGKGTVPKGTRPRQLAAYPRMGIIPRV